ncbi:MAG: hypothetical protein ACK4NZ_11320 [Tsuneonella sp.]
MLSSAQLEKARNVREYEVVQSTKGSGACAQMEDVLAQLTVMGSGLLKLNGRGEMEVDQRIWGRLAVGQRDHVMQALAVQNRCETGGTKGTAVVRDIASPLVLGRYTET